MRAYGIDPGQKELVSVVAEDMTLVTFPVLSSTDSFALSIDVQRFNDESSPDI